MPTDTQNLECARNVLDGLLARDSDRSDTAYGMLATAERTAIQYAINAINQLNP